MLLHPHSIIRRQILSTQKQSPSTQKVLPVSFHFSSPLFNFPALLNVLMRRASLMDSMATDKDKSSPPSLSPSSSFASYKEMIMMMKPSAVLRCVRFVALVLLCYLLWLRLLFSTFPPPASYLASGRQQRRTPAVCDPAIAPFYIHRLHPRFNVALVNRCLSRQACCDVCPHVGHRGLGRPLLRLPGGAADAEGTAWYATHPFAAEMIFHARAEQHPCRTDDPSAARLFFVPFYAGLHAATNFQQQNRTRRDALAAELADHLSLLSVFRRRGGRDHFLAVGRTAWDFMRDPGYPDSGANRLLLLPEIANMTVLTVERHPWEGRNQVGIPYPSYFHPRTAEDLADWQAELRRFGRTHLFTFVGGLRPTSDKAAVRADILAQCGNTKRCLAVHCESESRDCTNPDLVLDVMRRADFCLQPPGESYTRRSTFDSVLAGCIPVFFSEHSAYTQYEGYMPDRTDDWSVLLKQEKWGRVEDELSRIPRAKVERMREAVIEMIPTMTYAHPDANQAELGFRDAVDVALLELTKRVQRNTLV